LRSTGRAEGPRRGFCVVGDENGAVDPASPPPKLAYAVYLDAIGENVAALTAVLSQAAAHTRVPGCPEWSVGQLGAHAGDFAAFYSHLVCDTTGAARPPWPNTWRHGGSAPLNGQPAASYFDDRAQFLLSLLRATSPDAEVPTWNDEDRTAHFVSRRSAHEFAVHRVDAQLALGEPHPIDAELAADGIEEIFTMLDKLDMFDGSGEDGPGGTLHLRPEDAPREWAILSKGHAIEIRREPAAADLALAGTTSDLELLLYGRPTVGRVDRFGDPSVLDAWYQTFRFT
jgi:uncharacterized protein (TIGR03083 family)